MVEVLEGVVIRTVIFCEDVRQEAGNKWSVLGVFSADVIVGVVPAAVRLSLYIESEVSQPYKGPLDLRLRLENEEILVANGQLDAQPGITVLPVPQMVVGIPRGGMLHVDMGIAPDKWVEIGAKRVLVGIFKDGVLTAPTTSQQPS